MNRVHIKANRKCRRDYSLIPDQSQREETVSLRYGKRSSRSAQETSSYTACCMSKLLDLKDVIQYCTSVLYSTV